MIISLNIIKSLTLKTIFNLQRWRYRYSMMHKNSEKLSTETNLKSPYGQHYLSALESGYCLTEMELFEDWKCNYVSVTCRVLAWKRGIKAWVQKMSKDLKKQELMLEISGEYSPSKIQNQWTFIFCVGQTVEQLKSTFLFRVFVITLHCLWFLWGFILCLCYTKYHFVLLKKWDKRGALFITSHLSHCVSF